MLAKALSFFQSGPSHPPSFTDYLPWMEYCPGSKTFLLEDGRSVAAVWELTPVGTEGRSDAFKEGLRDRLLNLIGDTIPERDHDPWVLQVFVSDDFRLDELARAIGAYGQGEPDALARHYGAILTKHLERIAAPGGLFTETAADIAWRGRQRRIRLVLYRRLSRPNPGARPPEEDLNDLGGKVDLALRNAGIEARRYEGQDLYAWLLAWFNPAPACVDGDGRRLLEHAPYPGDDDAPFGRDFAEMLCLAPPEIDADAGILYLDGQAHQVVTTQGLRRAPQLGHFTGELRRGDQLYCLADRMPDNTTMAMTIVFTPQDLVAAHVQRIQDAAVGHQTEAVMAAAEAADVKVKMGRGDRLYPTEIAFYVRGADEQDLRRNRNRVIAQLVSAGLQPVEHDRELLLLDRWIGNLPMAFRAGACRHNRRSRYMFGSHLAAMFPVYGRSRGTGHPGLLFYNRGAEPLTFDPLNAKDRKKNGHLLLLGPTGAGKSALLIYLVIQMLAVHRPRLYIVEAGNSFGLLADHCARHGLHVNQMQLTAGAHVSLPPFASALDLLDRDPPHAGRDDRDPDTTLDEEDGRDILGEMEITAQLMITRGEVLETDPFRPADRLVVRAALRRAAEAVTAAGRATVLPSDVVAAMRDLSGADGLTATRRDRIREMADSMDLFTDERSLAGQLFNRPGGSWPEADVTLVDLATLAREGYEAELAVTYISLINHINDLVERRQHERRQTIVITDEGHVITTNPLLSKYVVKITKMWRKLGAWYWLATQNLEDFPEGARRMLTMMEWWLCLVMPKEEVDQMARFRDLSDEQRRLLLDARKEPGKFVEGVVLSDHLGTIFRNVPPPLCLALAMTEKHEKARRAELMRQHGLKTELDAVYHWANEMAHTKSA